jgi:D-tyrosyl-tRNA(Tyr) deacylase
MRAVVQRVASASVCVVDGESPRETGQIGPGLLVLVGVERGDTIEDARYLAAKIREMRVFRETANDDRMNLSVADAGGAVLVISQFTLAGDCRKGRRPSFDDAAPADVARPLYEAVVSDLKTSGLSVATGEFQATMQVALVNDGPVTLLLDSKKRF